MIIIKVQKDLLLKLDENELTQNFCTIMTPFYTSSGQSRYLLFHEKTLKVILCWRDIQTLIFCPYSSNHRHKIAFFVDCEREYACVCVCDR